MKIQFVSDDSVRILARGTNKTFTFSDLGFADGRKGDRPDMQWNLLKYMADHHGKLSWSEVESTRLASKAK